MDNNKIRKLIKAKGLEYLYVGRELYGIVLRKSYQSHKISFFTPPVFSQQLGYLPHNKGSIIEAHRHKFNIRKIFRTQETLFVKKARTKINSYNRNNLCVGSANLSQGDFILICTAGHGFQFRKDTVMIEIKQGPYNDFDKEYFEGVERCK